MAKRTKYSRKLNNGKARNSSLNGREAGNDEADPSCRPNRQPAQPGSNGESTSNEQTRPAIHLSDAQHAQITEAVLNQGQIGIAIVGVEGRVQYANQAFARLLQYRQEELIGKTLENFGYMAGRKTNLRVETEPQQGKGRPSPVLNQLVGKSGRSVACLIEFHHICDDSGKLSHFLLFVGQARERADAEEQSRFESELYRSLALQTLGMLAGGVAHDFNNALEVIIGFASLARTRLSSADPLDEPLKFIEESAKGAASLVRQLLDVSKDNADDEEPISVEELINGVLTIIGRTFDRKIRIEHRIVPDLLCIRGIRNRLEQAILNLCINARDAMQQGGTLTLEAAPATLGPKDPRLPVSNTPGHYARIAVRDTGVGMTAEVMKRIFVPLFTTKGPDRGSGLGLAMVNRIVKKSGGFITVRSKAGGGSEFALYLPAEFSGQPRAAHPKPSQPISGRGTVLVVDDEPRVLEFLEKGLTRLGYKVVSAKSGSQACETYFRQRHEVDCVLLDLIMPGMSGLETYSRLRDINSRVKVILASGYSSRRLKREAVKAGSSGFLEKPYTLAELSQALQKIQQN